MDAATAGLLGTFIGAATGVLGGLVGGWQQRKVEALRWRNAQVDEAWKEERRSLLELTTLLAEGCQAAVWLTWTASHKNIEAVRDEVLEYDTRMRALLPKIFAAQAAAAGLSETTYGRIDPLVQDLLALDDHLAQAIARSESDPAAMLPLLGTYEATAYELTRHIVQTVRATLSQLGRHGFLQAASGTGDR